MLCMSFYIYLHTKFGAVVQLCLVDWRLSTITAFTGSHMSGERRILQVSINMLARRALKLKRFCKQW